MLKSIIEKNTLADSIIPLPHNFSLKHFDIMNVLTTLNSPLPTLPAPHQYMEKGNQGQIIITDLVVAILAPQSVEFNTETVASLYFSTGKWYEVTTLFGIIETTAPVTLPINHATYFNKFNQMRFRLPIETQTPLTYKNELYCIEYLNSSKLATSKTRIDLLTFTDPVFIFINDINNSAHLFY